MKNKLVEDITKGITFIGAGLGVSATLACAMETIGMISSMDLDDNAMAFERHVKGWKTSAIIGLISFKITDIGINKLAEMDE